MGESRQRSSLQFARLSRFCDGWLTSPWFFFGYLGRTIRPHRQRAERHPTPITRAWTLGADGCVARAVTDQREGNVAEARANDLCRLSGLCGLAAFIQQLYYAVLWTDVQAPHLTLRDVGHHLSIGIKVADLALELHLDRRSLLPLEGLTFGNHGAGADRGVPHVPEALCERGTGHWEVRAAEPVATPTIGPRISAEYARLQTPVRE